MTRVTITLPNDLLVHVDLIADQDYTSRSSVIRRALLFYMRALATDMRPAAFDKMFKELKNRQLHAYLNKVAKDL